jgi:hypothetical protein
LEWLKTVSKSRAISAAMQEMPLRGTVVETCVVLLGTPEERRGPAVEGEGGEEPSVEGEGGEGPSDEGEGEERHATVAVADCVVLSTN